MKNKFKWYLAVLVILSFVTYTGSAQSIKRQSIGSYGSVGVTDNVFISQTIGQPFFTLGYRDNQVVFTQGFQQPVNYRSKITEPRASPLQFDIFPNPVSDNFNIEFPEIIENAFVKVTDINGRMIWEAKVPELQNYQMKCSHWQNGVYFITVYTEDKQQSYISRFIINK